MPYSARPKQEGAPRPNHIISLVARDLAWAARDLDRVSKALYGREFLVAEDIVEAQHKIDMVQASIVRVSLELASPSTSLLLRGANKSHAVEGGGRS